VEIGDVVAIGPAHAERLGVAGVATTEDLIEQAGTRAARHRLAISTGIGESLLLRLTNHVDLMAIDGVGQEYASLLEAAGVSCADELVQRDPQHLSESMADLIASRVTTRHVPDPGEIAYWIAQATRRTDRVEQ
jgi:predicted RecB family nuclease